jgi:hypothetical protein
MFFIKGSEGQHKYITTAPQSLSMGAVVLFMVENIVYRFWLIYIKSVIDFESDKVRLR